MNVIRIWVLLVVFLLQGLHVCGQCDEGKHQNKKVRFNRLVRDMDRNIALGKYGEALCNFDETIIYLEERNDTIEILDRCSIAIEICKESLFYRKAGYEYIEPSVAAGRMGRLLALVFDYKLPNCKSRVSLIGTENQILQYLNKEFKESEIIGQVARWISKESCIEDIDKYNLAIYGLEELYKINFLKTKNGIRKKDDYIKSSEHLIQSIEDSGILCSFPQKSLLDLNSILALRYAELYFATLDTIYKEKADEYINGLIDLHRETRLSHSHHEKHLLPHNDDRYSNRLYESDDDGIGRERKRINANLYGKEYPLEKKWDGEVKQNINKAIGLLFFHDDRGAAFSYFDSALYDYERLRGRHALFNDEHVYTWVSHEYGHLHEYQWYVHYLELCWNHIPEDSNDYIGLEKQKKIYYNQTPASFFTYLPNQDYSVPLEYFKFSEREYEARIYGPYHKERTTLQIIQDNSGMQEVFSGDFFYEVFLKRKDERIERFVYTQLYYDEIIEEGSRNVLDFNEYHENIDFSRLEEGSSERMVLEGQIHMEKSIFQLQKGNWENDMLQLIKTQILNLISCISEKGQLPYYKIEDVFSEETVLKPNGLGMLLSSMVMFSNENYINDGSNGSSMVVAREFSSLIDKIISYEIWIEDISEIRDWIAAYVFENRSSGDDIILESVYRLRDFYSKNINENTRVDSIELKSFIRDISTHEAWEAYDNGEYEKVYELLLPHSKEFLVRNDGSVVLELFEPYAEKFVKACYRTGRYEEARDYSMFYIENHQYGYRLQESLGLIYLNSIQRLNIERDIDNGLDYYSHVYGKDLTHSLFPLYYYDVHIDRDSARVINSEIESVINSKPNEVEKNEVIIALHILSILNLNWGDLEKSKLYYSKALKQNASELERNIWIDKEAVEYYKFLNELYFTIYEKRTWSQRQIDWFAKNKKVRARELYLLLARIDGYGKWDAYLESYDEINKAFQSINDVKGELDAHYMWFTAKNRLGEGIGNDEALNVLARMDELSMELESGGKAEVKNGMIPVVESLIQNQIDDNNKLEFLTNSLSSSVNRKMELIDTLNNTIIERNNAVSQKDSLIVEKDCLIQDKMELIEERDHLNDSLKNKNSMLRFWIFLFSLASLVVIWLYHGARKSNVQLERERKINIQQMELIELQKHDMEHNVKNNLELINAFVQDIKLKHLRNSGMKAELSKIHDLIQAMSRVFSVLYQKAAMDTNASEFLKNLSNVSAEAMQGVNMDTGFKFNIQDARLNFTVARRVGIIVNEAIRNAMKYGGNESHFSEIEIKYEVLESGQHYMAISDNGRGFDYDKVEKSTGIRLIEDMGASLKSTIIPFVNTGKGMRVQVLFNPSKLS